jgi:hypothetical protein
MPRFLTGLAIAVLTIGAASPALAGPLAVPEIDPSVASALMMLVGGVLVLLGLRRRD